MKNQKAIVYVAGALIGALSLYGIYRATQGDRDAVNAAAQSASPETQQQHTSGETAVAPSTLADNDLRLLDAAAAGITQASVAGGECWLDYFEQDGKVVSGDAVANDLQTQFYGWGVTTNRAQAATRMLIQFNPVDASMQGRFLPVNSSVARDDVTRAKGSDSYKQSGFYRAGVLNGLPKGKYHLYLLIETPKELTQCDLNRYVVIQQGS